VAASKERAKENHRGGPRDDLAMNVKAMISPGVSRAAKGATCEVSPEGRLMDNTALKAAVAGRGFSRLSATQQQQVVNDAVHELDAHGAALAVPADDDDGDGSARDDGPAGGLAGREHDDLNLPVDYIGLRGLGGVRGELDADGADPSYWYFTPGSTTSISGFPVTTRTVKVVYWKVSTDLSARRIRRCRRSLASRDRGYRGSERVADEEGLRVGEGVAGDD
jgi:hypothetical protein